MDAIRKILVVDDDPVVGKSFDRILTGKGYAVIRAGDAEEAMNKLHQETYDMVFTDIRMPGMNGIEMTEQIKARQPWLPVVIVTGYGTEANEARARAAGASEFLRKPLSPEMIEVSADRALHAAIATDTVNAEQTPTEAAAPQAGISATRAVLTALAAPFIGLAMLIALPIAGLPALLWLGARELVRHGWLRKAAGVAKNVALFFAAPFVGLLYLVTFPFVGMGMMAWMGARRMMQYPAFARAARTAGNGALLIAAPLIGLAYLLALPVIGLMMLTWFGGKALMRK